MDLAAIYGSTEAKPTPPAPPDVRARADDPSDSLPQGWSSWTEQRDGRTWWVIQKDGETVEMFDDCVDPDELDRAVKAFCPKPGAAGSSVAGFSDGGHGRRLDAGESPGAEAQR